MEKHPRNAEPVPIACPRCKETGDQIDVDGYTAYCNTCSKSWVLVPQGAKLPIGRP